jgi:hypothetical protein
MLAISTFVFFLAFKIMTDPDAPSPSDPYLREHLHWFVSSKSLSFSYTAFNKIRIYNNCLSELLIIWTNNVNDFI